MASSITVEFLIILKLDHYIDIFKKEKLIGIPPTLLAASDLEELNMKKDEIETFFNAVYNSDTKENNNELDDTVKLDRIPNLRHNNENDDTLISNSIWFTPINNDNSISIQIFKYCFVINPFANITIGRYSKTCNVVIDHVSISRSHCEIEHMGLNKLKIIDTNSKRLCYLKMLSSTKIYHDMILLIGNTVLKFFILSKNSIEIKVHDVFNNKLVSLINKVFTINNAKSFTIGNTPDSNINISEDNNIYKNHVYVQKNGDDFEIISELSNTIFIGIKQNIYHNLEIENNFAIQLGGVRFAVEIR